MNSYYEENEIVLGLAMAWCWCIRLTVSVTARDEDTTFRFSYILTAVVGTFAHPWLR